MPRAGSHWRLPAAASAQKRCSRTPRSTAWSKRRPRELGVGLAWLVNALDPGTVVIGGGLGLVDRYRELAVEAMRPLIFADNTREVPVVPAELGLDAGVIGAALVAAGART